MVLQGLALLWPVSFWISDLNVEQTVRAELEISEWLQVPDVLHEVRSGLPSEKAKELEKRKLNSKL
ncbi:hypothetical protein Dsin_013053 [Dipteronia sinensis]|uniref:Uncharacterized protein n=1 Tax=Dipteronia sinensis TaxID=43782 RepID=A0AAE0E8I5_9ROSI|nr:hypothetical protein Dsin_013053 [Dipteronia sinensis]